MKGFASQEIQDYKTTSDETLGSLTKCTLVAIYENDGKTILQPLVTEQEAKAVMELFENQTLEVWLSNGKPDISEFDVAILKYKQIMQSLTTCERAKSQVCLKNLDKNLISCEQYSLSAIKGER